MIPNAIQDVQRRRFLEIATLLANEPPDSLYTPILVGYARALSWRLGDQAEEALWSLVSAIRRGEPTGEWLGVLTGGVEA